MTRINDVDDRHLRQMLTEDGVRLGIGGIVYRLIDPSGCLLPHLRFCYRHHHIIDDRDLDDFHLRFIRIRRPFRPDLFTVDMDGPNPINPLPLSVAPMMMEMAMNWCMAGCADYFLALHGAVLAKEGRGLVLPARSGSGKSTLAGAFMARGWRLLSDEFALVDLRSSQIHAMPRPVSLKNASIAVMRDLIEAAHIGPPYSGTAKGTVSFMAPDAASVTALDPVTAQAIVVPQYQKDAGCTLGAMAPAEMMLRLVQGGANYERLGEAGYDALLRLIDEAPALARLQYGDMDAAMDLLERLVADPALLETS